MSAHNDHTDRRLRAFLASMRPLPGCADIEDGDEYQRGRSAIERLANNAQGDDYPTLRLSIREVADVLNYLGSSSPIDERDWWKDPDDAPSHSAGYKMLMDALEASLRTDPGPARSDEALALKSLLEKSVGALFEAEAIIRVAATAVAASGDERLQRALDGAARLVEVSWNELDEYREGL
jgi:hypothetical protein